MSEMINNREYRQKVLKELILELHNGKSVEEVKQRFEKLIQGISATEISEMEKALILEGMPIENIQKLCDVHAAVFKGSIEEIHRTQKSEEIPGHPVHTFRLENKELEKLINNNIRPYLDTVRSSSNQQELSKLLEGFRALQAIDKHYSRKENLLFPYLEKYGITAPPKVMWGVDDEIRDDIKDYIKLLSKNPENNKSLQDKGNEILNKVIEMIFKEENILFPMALDTLSEDEWLKIAEESKEIGYCIINPVESWKPKKINVTDKVKNKGEIPSNNGYISFDAGILLPEEINSILNTLPVDITFVDKEGAVKYFSMGKERIFPRPKTIIGRLVQNCHPPASVHIVA
jgi:DUF438 domain-containing protein